MSRSRGRALRTLARVWRVAVRRTRSASAAASQLQLRTSGLLHWRLSTIWNSKHIAIFCWKMHGPVVHMPGVGGSAFSEDATRAWISCPDMGLHAPLYTGTVWRSSAWSRRLSRCSGQKLQTVYPFSKKRGEKRGERHLRLLTVRESDRSSKKCSI